MNYLDIPEDTEQGQEYLDAIREESLEKPGYLLKPSELFRHVVKRGNGDGKSESNFIIEDIQKILINIQNSTMGTSREEDFDHLFEDLDLNSTKLGRTAEQRNEVIAKVLSHLDKIDFQLEHPQHNKLDAEALVANPPFSAKWSASTLFMTDDRFSEYGKLAPSSKADFAFIQHMIYHLAENGVWSLWKYGEFRTSYNNGIS